MGFSSIRVVMIFNTALSSPPDSHHSQDCADCTGLTGKKRIMGGISLKTKTAAFYL